MKKGILQGVIPFFGNGDIQFTRFGVICDGKNIEVMSDDKVLEQSVIDMLANSDRFKTGKSDPNFDACTFIGGTFALLNYDILDYSGAKADKIRNAMDAATDGMI